LAHAHMSRWWRAGAEPRLSRVFRWHRSSPQHVVGHLDRVRELQGLLDGLPGLGVAGSGFRAVGIPDVVADARAEPSRLIERWHRRYHATVPGAHRPPAIVGSFTLALVAAGCGSPPSPAAPSPAPHAAASAAT